MWTVKLSCLLETRQTFLALGKLPDYFKVYPKVEQLKVLAAD